MKEKEAGSQNRTDLRTPQNPSSCSTKPASLQSLLKAWSSISSSSAIIRLLELLFFEVSLCWSIRIFHFGQPSKGNITRELIKALWKGGDAHFWKSVLRCCFSQKNWACFNNQTLGFQKLLPQGNQMDVPFSRDQISRDFCSTPTKHTHEASYSLSTGFWKQQVLVLTSADTEQNYIHAQLLSSATAARMRVTTSGVST